MPKWFDHFSPTRIGFEAGSGIRLGERISHFGSRFIIINLKTENQNSKGLVEISESISSRAEGCIVYDEIIGAPDTEQVDTATYYAKRAHVDCIVAFGGLGSIDAAKAVALMANNSFFTEELYNQPPENINPPLPLITIPQEPCMGEELSGYFSLIDAQTSIKKLYSSDLLFPAACFYDITLASSLRKPDAAKIGGAIMTYAVEKLISGNTNLATETLLQKVISMLKKDLTWFYKDPANETVLNNIYWASAMCGISLMTNPAGPTWVMAQVLSAKTKIDYHNALSLLLPYVMEYFLTASSKKYVSIARLLGENIDDISVVEAAIQGIEAIRNLFASLNLPTRLSEFYVTEQQVAEAAEQIALFPHLKNSPKKMNRDEIESILMTAM